MQHLPLDWRSAQYTRLRPYPVSFQRSTLLLFPLYVYYIDRGFQAISTACEVQADYNRDSRGYLRAMEEAQFRAQILNTGRVSQSAFKVLSVS